MYKLPWSQTDNQGGWVEVTDRCNLLCPGCYRQRLEGDKPLEKVKQEILLCRKLTNCDTMVIAGGEPLIYPYITEVIRFISSLGLKPLLLTNGKELNDESLGRLKEAGLKRIHIHVDAQQEREGWSGKNETELNELRQVYADMLWKHKGIQCGFHITVVRETLAHIPAIMKWYRAGMHKVQHISLIALRGIPVMPGFGYFVKDSEVPEDKLVNLYPDTSNIDITTEEILDIIRKDHPDYLPSAYISGDALPETDKQLFIVNIGSEKSFFGVMGAMSMELTQAFYHLLRGRYFSFIPDPVIGKKVFLMSIFDKQMRKTLGIYLEKLLKNPRVLFEKVYLQSMIIQQPIEFIRGEKNVCEHCVNPMIFNDMLINPCELDEYRVYGDTIVPQKKLKLSLYEFRKRGFISDALVQNR